MGDKYSKLKVAAVQAAPVFLDREGSLNKAVDLIEEAAENGANLVVFPEGFIPTHPVWFHFHAGTSGIATKLSEKLFENSVEIPGPEIDILAEAAAKNQVYIIMGVCEKLPETTGTMYNTQIVIGPDGDLIGKRQKLMPTVGERFVHKGGSGASLKTFSSEYGPISAMMCSENSNPLAIFTLIAEGTRIHGMSWPNHWGTMSPPMRKYVSIASLNFAQMAKSFVISACSTVSERMVEMMELSATEKEFLEKPEMSGGSMIVDPGAKIIAGPMDNKEGIIYADIDLTECIEHKLHHDFAGHYNREDIFQLKINRGTPQFLEEINFPEKEKENEKIEDNIEKIDLESKED
ncbi:MAG TPA: carbon-nitrogen hydrolase family protein [Halanaerobiales bacterium]|nr:carbon-nitrogen hydrolase family protein [Halanaerobiales bacterium]